MNNLQIAQAVLDKVLKVTMAPRIPDLVKAFTEAGFTVDVDARKVTDCGSNPDCFRELAGALASGMPTALICTKRVLAENHIQI